MSRFERRTSFVAACLIIVAVPTVVGGALLWGCVLFVLGIVPLLVIALRTLAAAPGEGTANLYDHGSSEPTAYESGVR